MNTPPEQRLRQHPEERFGADQNIIDIPGTLRALRSESAPVRDGHRQITLDQSGPVTLVLFAFEAGGQLRDHHAAGVVTIHGLEGKLHVSTEAREYALSPNKLVVLAPNISHSVLAETAGALLLTVCLVPDTRPES